VDFCLELDFKMCNEKRRLRTGRFARGVAKQGSLVRIFDRALCCAFVAEAVVGEGERE